MPPSTRRAPRAPSAAPIVLAAAAAAVALGACHPREERDPRRAERAAVRDAARRAAALATGDSTPPDPDGHADAHDGSRDGSHDDSQPHARVQLGVGDAGALVRGGDPPLGPGDVRVVSTDGALVLALLGDTVRMRLGDSVTAKLRREVEAGADSASGFGGFVARTVKGAVGGAMAEAARFAVRVPVTEVRELRYEDGELRFGSDRGRRKHKEHTSARFAPDDAERFIRAVRARQRALGVPEAGG